jgi:hypothetical protein
MVDLVAKRTTSKVSAQWSNDESVHQILVELLDGENVDTSELLRKVWLTFGEYVLMTGSDRGVTVEEGQNVSG